MALDRHEPAGTAAHMQSLGIPHERLWLGIGAGFTTRPLTVVREGLEAMRAALPEGTRLVVAAMGPKMCALAGAEADGVFLNWMTPAKAAWARERVHEGAREAGRETPPPVFGYVRVAVGDDAEQRLLKEESFYRGLHQGYIRHFEALDASPGSVGIAAREPERGRSPPGRVRGRDRPHRRAGARTCRRRVARRRRRGRRTALDSSAVDRCRRFPPG